MSYICAYWKEADLGDMPESAWEEPEVTSGRTTTTTATFDIATLMKNLDPERYRADMKAQIAKQETLLASIKKERDLSRKLMEEFKKLNLKCQSQPYPI